MNFLLTYNRFQDEQAAAGFTALLEQAGMQYRLEKEIAYPDKVYFGQALDAGYVLKLAPEDFDRMNALLEDQARQDVKNPDPDYYLYSFTLEELKNLISQPLEWNPYDVMLAKLLYLEKGGEARLLPPPPEETYHPQRIGLYWIVLGYIASCFSIPGLIIGTALVSASKTLRNGTEVPLFDPYTRAHGRRINLIAFIMLVLFILFNVYRQA